MLISVTVVSVSAAADIEMSMTDAKGKPGDTVEISIYYDKNAGAYASYFDVLYDGRCFELLEIVDGEVFSAGEHMEGNIDASGSYRYYAENNGLENTVGTGLLITLKFKILKAAPNGDYDVTIQLPEDLGGYFFDVTDIYTDEYPARSVEVTKTGVITVTDSDAGPLPETTLPPETTKDPETTKKPAGSKHPATEIVTEFVTDAEGEVVTDVAGDPVVTDVVVEIPEATVSPEEETTVKSPETEIVYVTDAEGEQVTDIHGEAVTEIVEKEEGKPLSVNTIVVIVCVIAVVAAALITVFVVVSRKKDTDGEDKAE